MNHVTHYRYDREGHFADVSPLRGVVVGSGEHQVSAKVETIEQTA